MRQIAAKGVESVLRLDGPARYQHFLMKVADAEVAWGLWKDGWALMRDDAGVEVFPLWPAREYAEASRAGEWADFEPEEIGLDDLLRELLPKLAAKSALPGVFPTPTGVGVTPTVGELDEALRNEMAKYGDRTLYTSRNGWANASTQPKAACFPWPILGQPALKAFPAAQAPPTPLQPAPTQPQVGRLRTRTGSGTRHPRGDSPHAAPETSWRRSAARGIRRTAGLRWCWCASAPTRRDRRAR